MRYVNTKTGIEFESPCKIKGENIAEAKQIAVEKTEEKPEPKKKGTKKK